MPGFQTDQPTGEQDIGGIRSDTTGPAMGGMAAVTRVVINHQLRQPLARLRRTTRRHSFRRSIEPNRVTDAMGRHIVDRFGAARMRQCACAAMALGILVFMSACAQSVHQTQRLAQQDFMLDPGYAGAQNYSYWPGPGYGYGIGYGAGYWGGPLGYYGVPYGPLGFGWYGGYGGFGAARPPSSMPGARPSPPPHAPPQFRKKY